LLDLAPCRRGCRHPAGRQPITLPTEARAEVGTSSLALIVVSSPCGATVTTRRPTSAPSYDCAVSTHDAGAPAGTRTVKSMVIRVAESSDHCTIRESYAGSPYCR